MLLSVVSATQLCAGCTLEFEPLVKLGAADDPAGVGIFAEVLGIGDLGYLVSSDALGGTVIVYDSAGRFQRELTREGEGPGEFLVPPKFAMGADGILMLEPGSRKLDLFSDGLDFIRTFQVPGVAALWSIRSDSATGGWLVGYQGESDWTEKGVLLLDQSGDVIRSMQVSEEFTSSRLTSWAWVDVTRGANGLIWSTSLLGRVELYDDDLRLLGSLQLELPGMDEWEPTGPGLSGRPAEVTDVYPVPDGSGVWVFAFAVETEYDEDVIKGLHDGMSTLEQVVDAFVYSVRLGPKGLELVGMDRFDTLVRPLRDGALAYDLVETPDGNRRVRVGRLRFSGGSRLKHELHGEREQPDRRARPPAVPSLSLQAW